MPRYGPDDPNYPDDQPTAYLGPPVEDPVVPWYRKPAALVAFGALGAVLIALVVYGLAKLITGSDSPTEQTSLTPLTTTSRAVVTTTEAPSTVTETVTPTTTEPPTTTTTTTEPTTTTTTTTTTEATTSVSTSTSTSTVTETVTVPPPPG